MARRDNDNPDPEDAPLGQGMARQTANRIRRRQEMLEGAHRSGRGSSDTTGDRARSKQEKGDKSAADESSDWKGVPYK